MRTYDFAMRAFDPSPLSRASVIASTSWPRALPKSPSPVAAAAAEISSLMRSLAFGSAAPATRATASASKKATETRMTRRVKLMMRPSGNKEGAIYRTIRVVGGFGNPPRFPITNASRALRVRCGRRTRCSRRRSGSDAVGHRAPARGSRARPGTGGRARRRASCPRSPASARTSMSLVPMSRWLVGSSSTRKLGVVVEHPRQHEARLLAAGEHAAALLDVVAREAEAAGQRPQRRRRWPAGTPSAAISQTVCVGSSSSIACWAK